MRYINAGHEPPLLVRRDGTLEAVDSTTLPFAMIEEMPMPVSELTLNPGDEITVFSDGIPEATTARRPLPGARRRQAHPDRAPARAAARQSASAS